jgi:hypothetical protein
MFFKVRARGFVEEGRGVDSECGSDSDGGKDGVCLDTSDDEELVVKASLFSLCVIRAQVFCSLL